MYATTSLLGSRPPYCSRRETRSGIDNGQSQGSAVCRTGAAPYQFSRARNCHEQRRRIPQALSMPAGGKKTRLPKLDEQRPSHLRRKDADGSVTSGHHSIVPTVSFSSVTTSLKTSVRPRQGSLRKAHASSRRPMESWRRESCLRGRRRWRRQDRNGGSLMAVMANRLHGASLRAIGDTSWKGGRFA